MINDDDAIANDFRKFHRENPDVYLELVKISRQLKDRGRNHYGIGALFEVIRFHRAIRTNDPVFKLNNNYRALYARLIMDQEADLSDFFETRVRKANVRHQQYEKMEDLYEGKS